MARPAKFRREARHIRRRRAAEAVDGLALVGDDPDVGSGLADGAKQPGAREIHVLVFVDQDVSEFREEGIDLGVLFDQVACEPQQIAEIDGISGHERFFVDPVNFGELQRLSGDLLGVGVVDRLGGREGGFGLGAIRGGADELVLATRDHAQNVDQLVSRLIEVLVIVERQLLQIVFEQGESRGLVQDADRRGSADAGGPFRDELIAEGVKGPGPDFDGGIGIHRGQPLAHLFRGFVREGEREDHSRGRSAAQEVLDPVHQGAGFAGSRACVHQ